MQGHDAFVWITQRLYHGDHGIMARCHEVMQPNLNSSSDVWSRYIVTGIKQPRTYYPPIHACPYKHCLKIIELCKVQRISSEHEIVVRRWKLSVRERSQVWAKFPAHHCSIITQHSPQIRLDGHLQPNSVSQQGRDRSWARAKTLHTMFSNLANVNFLPSYLGYVLCVCHDVWVNVYQNLLSHIKYENSFSFVCVDELFIKCLKIA